MKANPCGTMSEQARHKMGFQTPSERKASGNDRKGICRECHYHEVRIYKKGDESTGYSIRCAHLMTSGDGFATRETAGCEQFKSATVSIGRPLYQP